MAGDRKTAFDFRTAGHVAFGPGRLSELAGLCKPLGTRCLLVTGSNPERSASVERLLNEAGDSFDVFRTTGEPSISQVEEGANQAVEANAEFVIGFGGGSAVDASKAIAALATNRRPVLSYLEVIGEGQPLENDPLPVIAVPTTAGTGAEATRNAVLFSPQHKVKVSLRHPGLLPRVALVDPELTLSVPASVTAATGMDALTQLIEPFLSCRANPMTDALCREGISMAYSALPKAVSNGGDLQVRTEMSLAALWSGQALANSGLGAVHGFAAPLGGMFESPHGAVCAALLPAVLRMNYRVLSQSAREPYLERFRELAEMIAGRPGARVEGALEAIQELKERLKIPGLARYGISSKDVPALVEKGKAASSMKGNPVVLTDEQLAEVLEESME